MKFKKLFSSLVAILTLTFVSLSNVVYAGSSSVSLAEQESTYGDTWKDKETPGWKAIQCQGFAIRMKYESSGGNDVKNWKKIYTIGKITDLQAGDIVRYTRYSDNTKDLHSIFITEVCDDGTIYFAHANVDNKNGIHWRDKMEETLKERIMTSINKEGTKDDPTYIWR